MTGTSLHCWECGRRRHGSTAVDGNTGVGKFTAVPCGHTTLYVPQRDHRRGKWTWIAFAALNGAKRKFRRKP